MIIMELTPTYTIYFIEIKFKFELIIIPYDIKKYYKPIKKVFYIYWV